jgi:hypothetical protein
MLVYTEGRLDDVAGLATAIVQGMGTKNNDINVATTSSSQLGTNHQNKVQKSDH